MPFSARQKAPEAAAPQFLTFFVGAYEYAIDILKVREVLEYEPVTRVPLTPACIRGVLNVRGSVIPIIDLAIKFGGAPEPTTMKTCVVLVELPAAEGAVTLGFVADSVHRVTEFAPQDLVAPPPFGTPIHIDYLHAMGRVGKSFVLVLDIAKVLSTEELLAATSLDPEWPTEVAAP